MSNIATPSPVPTSSDNTQNIDLKKIFNDLIADPKANSFPYDFFLTFTKQKQANTAYLIDILQRLRPLVHVLDPKLFEPGLVHMLFFEIKWSAHGQSRPLLDSLAEFLIDLNSAYTSYIYKCLTMLIRNFLVHDSSEWEREIFSNCLSLTGRFSEEDGNEWHQIFSSLIHDL